MKRTQPEVDRPIGQWTRFLCRVIILTQIFPGAKRAMQAPSFVQYNRPVLRVNETGGREEEEEEEGQKKDKGVTQRSSEYFSFIFQPRGRSIVRKMKKSQ